MEQRGGTLLEHGGEPGAQSRAGRRFTVLHEAKRCGTRQRRHHPEPQSTQIAHTKPLRRQTTEAQAQAQAQRHRRCVVSDPCGHNLQVFYGPPQGGISDPGNGREALLGLGDRSEASVLIGVEEVLIAWACQTKSAASSFDSSIQPGAAAEQSDNVTMVRI